MSILVHKVSFIYLFFGRSVLFHRIDTTSFNVLYQSPSKNIQVIPNHWLCPEERMSHPVLSGDSEGGGSRVAV